MNAGLPFNHLVNLIVESELVTELYAQRDFHLKGNKLKGVNFLR